MSVDFSRFFPVIPMRNTVLYPGLTVPIRIGRPKSVAALKATQKDDGWLLAVTVREEEEDKEVTSDRLFNVGTLCRIERVRGSDEAGFQALVQGVYRFKVAEWKDGKKLEAKGDSWPDRSDMEEPVERALLRSLKETAESILELLPQDTRQLAEILKGIDDLSLLSFLCGANLEIPLDQKQALLEMPSLKARVLKLLELMQRQKEELQVQSEIRDRLSSKLGKVQREALLRQQLSAIKEELGEGDEKGLGDQYKKKIEEAAMPPEAKKIAEDELKRLEAMGSGSPEAHVIRNYIDLLTALPWSKSSPEEIDLAFARDVLEADHYGLDKVKKRILQYLAVRKLSGKGRAPILLLVGPPGVGKTSLGASIARALKKKFVRAALGGVRDDAEIRGHRRTYIGAMPGRVIQGLKRAGENNPVFLLDEVDKLATSFHGDPASALLEVLDPEQNATFTDHYVDTPFDLSKVTFLATANTLETIPRPLLDRMEVIELTGYTTPEKVNIARRHLWPKVLSDHGIKPEELTITDEALHRLLSHHTREAGVRELARLLAAVCRGAGERVLAAREKGEPVTIGVGDLKELVGRERFEPEAASVTAPVPGVVTGLAWTPVGGDILFIEAGHMPGNGKLLLTGQLGDVMKESAHIALSLVRSRLGELVPGFEYDKKDLHIHVPAGAIPKDGPSAGVAMFTAIASLFTGRSVSPRLAMTGEITLRGAVTPVGGIKEKVIAAHRAGIAKVILPRRNEGDLEDVPAEIRQGLEFTFVETVGDVLHAALGRDLLPFTPGWSTTPLPPAHAAA